MKLQRRLRIWARKNKVDLSSGLVGFTQGDENTQEISLWQIPGVDQPTTSELLAAVTDDDLDDIETRAQDGTLQLTNEVILKLIPDLLVRSGIQRPQAKRFLKKRIDDIIQGIDEEDGDGGKV